MLTWQIDTADAAKTEQLAATIGANLRGGEVIELVGDLGCGKTTFTRGLVRGTGSSDHVSSPTFTLRNEYSAPSFIVYHFDFYRLNEAGIMADELAETVGDKDSVTVVEWGNVINDVLPQQRITIQLQARTGSNGAENRQLIFRYPKEWAYIIDHIKS